MYEHLLKAINGQGNTKTSFSSILAASSLTALVTTTMAYPFDLAHGRMAGDMSKKPSIIVDKSVSK